MKFHPATQIMTWCLLVMTMQVQSFLALLLTASFISLAAVAVSRDRLFQLIRRTRWVMLSLLLIYAYSTPGPPLLDLLGIFSPSHEGLLGGVLQLTRLLAALAGLSILLDCLSSQQLIAGLYSLFSPLQWLGLSRERLAVRLALTLHYAEAAMRCDTHTWQDGLRSLFQPHGEAGAEKKIELPICRYMAGDVVLLGSALLLLVMALQ